MIVQPKNMAFLGLLPYCNFCTEGAIICSKFHEALNSRCLITIQKASFGWFMTHGFEAEGNFTLKSIPLLHKSYAYIWINKLLLYINQYRFIWLYIISNELDQYGVITRELSVFKFAILRTGEFYFIKDPLIYEIH